MKTNDEEFEKICREEVEAGETVIVGRQLKVPWSSFMEIFPLAQRQICVRWTGIDGIYRWLHPSLMTWIEEPNQIGMPNFSDYASARAAADRSPEPPTWKEYILQQDQP